MCSECDDHGIEPINFKELREKIEERKQKVITFSEAAALMYVMRYAGSKRALEAAKLLKGEARRLADKINRNNL